MKRIPGIFLLIFSLVNLVSAQTNNSPYSVLGIGDIEDSYFNRTNGMASTGIAYRSNRNLIDNNPASFSALDNQWFIGELGIRGKYINYSGKPVDPSNNRSFDITFRRFAVGTRIGKHWGSSVGLAPFSSENYEFNALQPIQGTVGETANAYYQGYGGVNRVYWTNAYDFFHHVSIGVNASYLFGSITQKTILQNPQIANAYVSTNKNLFLSNLYFNYGIQFYGKIGSHWNVVVGGTFANRSDLSAQANTTVLGLDSSVLKSQSVDGIYFTLPNMYGAGISITKDNKYTFLADYKFQEWSPLNYTGYNYALTNSNRVSLGFEISHKQNVYNNQVETNFFHAGVYYGDSYLNVFGQKIQDMGASLGVGLNTKRSPFAYTLTFQYGVKGTTNSQLIKENYFSISFLLSYRDFWFTRGKRFN